MHSSFSLLLITLATLSRGVDDPPCADGTFQATSTRWERGGAIIAIDSPMHPNYVRPLEPILTTQIVKVLEVFDDGQILLSFGTDRGVQKGDKIYLAARAVGAYSPLAGFVELTQVGPEYSVARFTDRLLFGLQAALVRKENPVRRDGLTWFAWPRAPYPITIPSYVPGRFERGGANIYAPTSKHPPMKQSQP